MKLFVVHSILFVIIGCIAFALRGPEILAKNHLFGFDQGRDYLAAYSIAEQHKFTLIGAEVGAGSAGLQGLFHGPGYFYLLALMYLLFQGDPYGGLVIMFLAGMTTVFLTFLIARKIFGTSAGLVAMFLVSIAPLIAPQARFIWNHHLTSPLIVVYFFLVYQLLVSKRTLVLAFLMTFVAGLLYHFELAVSVPLVLSTFVILVAVKRVRQLSPYVAAIGGAFLAYVPMILFEMRHGFMATRGMLSYLTHPKTEKALPFFSHILTEVNSFFGNARDTFVFESGFIPAHRFVHTILLFFVCVIAAYVLSRNDTHKKFITALGSTIIVSFIIFFFLNNSIWNYYLLHLHFVYIFFFTFALYTFCSVIAKRGPLAAYGGILFLTVFLLSMGYGIERRIYSNWTIDYPDFGGKEKVAGKRSMIDKIFADAQGKPFNVLVFTPPVYTYSYDYLLKTYALQKYGVVPGNEKKGLTYLIMEIDGTKPLSYQGWLDTVIKTGTILDHQYLPKEDVFIQKRMFEE